MKDTLGDLFNQIHIKHNQFNENKFQNYCIYKHNQVL